jgi:hypothetical protein
MKIKFYLIAFLVMSYNVSKADQKDPIDCNLSIYCENPSHGFSCGLIGDVEEDNKIEIIRSYTGTVYSATYNLTNNGVQVNLKAKDGTFLSEKTGLLNSQSNSIAMEVANTAFYCKLK